MNTPCEHCPHRWACLRSDWERECDREEEWEEYENED